LTVTLPVGPDNPLAVAAEVLDIKSGWPMATDAV
jgi:hypothetical protein